MSRRGHNEDSIYKDGDRWRGAVSLGYDANGKRKRKKVSGKTRAEVVKKVREIRALIDKGLPVPDDRLTIGDFLDRWINVTLPAGPIEPVTLDGYENTVRLYLRDPFGHKVMTRLSVREVNEVWAGMLSSGFSPNTVRIARTVLRAAFTQAEREGILARNVVALSNPPKLNPTDGRSLTVDQAKTLLAHLDGHRLSLVITIVLTYGTRRGEGLGFMWDGFDASAQTLRITHAVKRIKVRDAKPGERKTRLIVHGVKSRRSRRTLFLTPELTRLLVRHRAAQKLAREKAGDAWQENGLIFPSEVGTPLDPDNFSHAFSRIAVDAGLGHWHPHELRHSGASLMLAQGTPLHVVSEILGHAGIAITKDVYGHLVEGDKRAAAESLGTTLMGPVKGPRRHTVRGKRRAAAPKNEEVAETAEPNS